MPPIFVNLDTGISQSEAPQEVLTELVDDPNNDRDAEDQLGEVTTSWSHLGRAGGHGCEESPELEAGGPRFRRIVLGSKQVMPLRMARDILAALKEDIAIFDEAQCRFSDGSSEAALELGVNLPEDLECVGAALSPGELSDVIGTDAGMQILLRVS